MKNKEKLEELIGELRGVLVESGEYTPIDELDVEPEAREEFKKFDEEFDMTLFFSRKKGVPNSVCLCMSEADDVQVSAMTAILSLIQTMYERKLLSIDDITFTFATLITTVLPRNKDKEKEDE